MRRQNKSCTSDNSKGGERLDKPTQPKGWDCGFYVMKTMNANRVYSWVDNSRFCKYDWVWMSNVDFIDIGSYTYLVPKHGEIVRTRRCATHFLSMSRSGHKGFWDFVNFAYARFCKFCILDVIWLYIVYCNISYLVIPPHIIYLIALLIEYLPFFISSFGFRKCC